MIIKNDHRFLTFLTKLIMYNYKPYAREDLINTSLRLLKLQIDALKIAGKINDSDKKLLLYELKMEKYRGWIRLPLMVLHDYLEEKEKQHLSHNVSKQSLLCQKKDSIKILFTLNNIFPFKTN